MEQLPLYLDHHATTPCDPAVLEEMLPWFTQHCGNPSSRQHIYGARAQEAIGLARERVASLIGASPEEIVFTSGATESINLAIKGVARSYASKGKHIITTVSEHSAVIDTCQRLAGEGMDISWLPVDQHGLVDPDMLEQAIRPDTILVAIMMGNNETGVLQPIDTLSAVTRSRGALFFTDATQALGKVPVAVDLQGIDILACSAHKLYGPKGAGALYLRRKNPRVRVAPLFDGGGQEQGVRAGTQNVPGIVGFGKAAEISASGMKEDMMRIGMMRDRFEAEISKLPEVYINSGGATRLPTVTNLSVGYTDGSLLQVEMNRIAAISAGSACHSASGEPSHVLTAMGIGPDLAKASLRISPGRYTQPEEMERVGRLMAERIVEIRDSSAVWAAWKEGRLPEADRWKHPAQLP